MAGCSLNLKLARMRGAHVNLLISQRREKFCLLQIGAFCLVLRSLFLEKPRFHFHSEIQPFKQLQNADFFCSASLKKNPPELGNILNKTAKKLGCIFTKEKNKSRNGKKYPGGEKCVYLVITQFSSINTSIFISFSVV